MRITHLYLPEISLSYIGPEEKADTYLKKMKKNLLLNAALHRAVVGWCNATGSWADVKAQLDIVLSSMANPQAMIRNIRLGYTTGPGRTGSMILLSYGLSEPDQVVVRITTTLGDKTIPITTFVTTLDSPVTQFSDVLPCVLMTHTPVGQPLFDPALYPEVRDTGRRIVRDCLSKLPTGTPSDEMFVVNGEGPETETIEEDSFPVGVSLMLTADFYDNDTQLNALVRRPLPRSVLVSVSRGVREKLLKLERGDYSVGGREFMCRGVIDVYIELGRMGYVDLIRRKKISLFDSRSNLVVKETDWMSLEHGVTDDDDMPTVLPDWYYDTPSEVWFTQPDTREGHGVFFVRGDITHEGTTKNWYDRDVANSLRQELLKYTEGRQESLRQMLYEELHGRIIVPIMEHNPHPLQVVLQFRMMTTSGWSQWVIRVSSSVADGTAYLLSYRHTSNAPVRTTMSYQFNPADDDASHLFLNTVLSS